MMIIDTLQSTGEGEGMRCARMTDGQLATLGLTETSIRIMVTNPPVRAYARCNVHTRLASRGCRPRKGWAIFAG